MKDRFDIQHSPGPWRWADNGRDLLDANGRVLLTIENLQFDEDANLIVAGPALVKACREALLVLQECGFDDDTPAGAALDGLRDALRFARVGEEPGPIPDIFEDMP